MVGKRAPRDYELYLKRPEQIYDVVSYIARCAGVFFAKPIEISDEKQRIIDVYHAGAITAETHLFTLIQDKNNQNVLKVSGSIVTPEVIKEVQQALGLPE